MAVIDAPSGYLPREFELQLARIEGFTESPFTGVRQYTTGVGGGYWAGTMTLPEMVFGGAEHLAWLAVLGALKGIENDLRIEAPAPAGAAGRSLSLNASTPPATTTLSADAAAGARTITLAAIGGAILPAGSLIEVGGHLLQLEANCDGAADATPDASVFPPLRAAFVTGETVRIARPRGTFKVLGEIPVAYRHGRVPEFTFELREAF